MPHWFDTILVLLAVGGALTYFLVRGIRRWRASNSGCGGDCCSLAKKGNNFAGGKEPRVPTPVKPRSH